MGKHAGVKWLTFRTAKNKVVESKQLTELVTGIPGTKFNDLTDEYLQALGG